jgi:hypothetical protein
MSLHWVDVTETCDWATEVTNPVFCSIGWCISEPGADFVQLATTVDADGEYSSILSVPRGCVQMIAPCPAPRK